MAQLKPAIKPYADGLLAPIERRTIAAARRHQDVAIFLAPLNLSGGVLSILELAQVSRQIGRALGFDVWLAYPPSSWPRGRHPCSDTEKLASVSSVLGVYRDASRVWLHVPELILTSELPELAPHLASLSNKAQVIVNVLNQNIERMPSATELLACVSGASFKLTCTTAHDAYCQGRYRDEFGIPTHLFSTWISPADYEFGRYSTDRQSRILVSPDRSERRDEVAEMIRSTAPDLAQVTVSGMPYDQYLELLFASRWSLTFGEGLDAYFIEMALSGGIPFAVYNEVFFTDAFLTLPNVFASWDDLLERWPILFAAWNADSDLYKEVSELNRSVLGRYYDHRRHVDNVARYYAGQYDLP